MQKPKWIDPTEKKNFNPGDIVFFQSAKTSSSMPGEFRFKGHGVGVFLGYVPPGVDDPPLDHLLRIMGGAGFLSFDDVKTFLGEEALKTVLEKFTLKYLKPPILGADGKPINEVN